MKLIIILFIIRSIKLLIYFTYLFQLKEYRLDRMLVHLTTIQGKKLLLNPLSIVKWVLLIIWFSGFLNLSLLFLVIGCLYFFESVIFIKDLISKKVYFPELKKRIYFLPFWVISIVIISISIFGINIISLLIIDRLYALIITVGFFLTNRVFDIQKQFVINKAIKKLHEYPNLKIIGITGSYGKSSTKEFLATILEERYKVVKNPRSVNTVIGVAENILKNLKPETEILIVEMAAYKIGEIREITNLVKPQIAVLTAIGNQHLSLFGSMENLKKAKFELIEAIPHASLAVFNIENEDSRNLSVKAKKLGKKVVLTGLTSKADFCATDINKDKLSFSFKINNKEKYSANLLGTHNIENLLLAFAVARELGLSPVQIRRGIAKIKPLPQTMFPLILPNNIVLVDDTFNANPQAVFAALEYLKIYKNHKYFVLQPLIELGNQAIISHQEIARQAVKVCDRVFLTNTNYSRAIYSVLTEKEAATIKIDNPKKIAFELKSLFGKGDVCLFEGKETEKVLIQLKSLINL